ncbi:hypothetical protein EVAR_69075_1 [Eumeta japonica]|uniref:Uncharacterized protein n=1 Tax=Eumeta variegata TaxID=151549 RepID=A0A4C1ZJ38_EUMVA|nr:hypothetical protein EVAR_69075_1 [Eumeta japonica]
MCIRTVLTYASPVFAHAAPKALQVTEIWNSHSLIHEGRIEAIFRHRDHIPTLSGGRLSTAAPTHYRNVLSDPPDALTAAVDSLNDVNDTHD